MKSFKNFLIDGKMSDLNITFKEYNDKLRKECGVDLNIYKDQIKGGVADKITIEQILRIPINTLIKGNKVELEHTKDPYLAFEIELDHLFENPPKSFRYYDELQNMETKLKS